MAETFTIQISSDLVNRLVGNEDKVPKKTKKPKPKVKTASSAPKSSSVGEWPLHPPIFLSVAPPATPPDAIAELEAIRSVVEEGKKVLEKLEEREADVLQELTQRAKELHDKEFKLPYQNPNPCRAEREACLQCYRENLKDPLRCRQVVSTFADCARLARQRASSNEGK